MHPRLGEIATELLANVVVYLGRVCNCMATVAPFSRFVLATLRFFIAADLLS